LGDDREDDTGTKEDGSGNPNDQTGLGDRGVEVAADGLTVNDEDGFDNVIVDKEGEAEIEEEEIEYGYRMVDEEEDWEDEPEDEVDTDGEGGNLGPEDGDKGWEDDVFELEGYAPL
jgi:hypothetical protein